MRMATAVTVGNDYLAERARRAGAQRVEYFPTAVDLDRYRLTSRTETSSYRIGWIGSPITARYLDLVRPALIEASRIGDGEVTVIGGGGGVPQGIPVESRAW